MSRLFIFLNILFVLMANTTCLIEHNPKSKPSTFVIPIFKDNKTYLYYTNMTVGQPPLVVKLVVELSGTALFFQCDGIGYNSTTYTPVLCGSPGCAQTKDLCTTCSSAPFGPTCRNDTCISKVDSDLAYTGTISHLLNDDVIISYTSPSAYVSSKLAVRTRLACVDVFEDSAWSDLPNGANGILGLATSSMSFVKGLISSYKIPFKVALCLPSKPGNNSGTVYIGGGPYLLPPNHRDVKGLLVSTPLVSIPEHVEENYFIDVKSIEVNGKKLSFNQDLLTFNKTSHWGSTKISTTIPYTLLETSIYKALVKAFAGKAQRKAVYPFSDCFSYKSFGRKPLLGKETPVISLVLGGGAKWDIYGTNSLVMVNKTIMCIAFVDAGNGRRFPIEIGGYQMEDNLVEFDLEASNFSFTSSLLRHNASCSRM